MLSLTDTARNALQDITERAGLPEEGGLRIAETAIPGSFELSLVTGPADGDEVIDADGSWVFLESTSADALSEHELDATPTPEGTGFVLAERTEEGEDAEVAGLQAEAEPAGPAVEAEPVEVTADADPAWPAVEVKPAWLTTKAEPAGLATATEQPAFENVWDSFELEPDGFDRLAFRAVADDPEG
jgi:iron-sulfur cluster assembly protein